jgi:hypothetical protein
MDVYIWLQKKQYACNIEMCSAHLGMCHGTPTENEAHLHLNITVTYTYAQFVTKMLYFVK